jgi:hypothetical protein
LSEAGRSACPLHDLFDNDKMLFYADNHVSYEMKRIRFSAKANVRVKEKELYVWNWHA